MRSIVAVTNEAGYAEKAADELLGGVPGKSTILKTWLPTEKLFFGK